jgi:hypothetical protein
MFTLAWYKNLAQILLRIWKHDLKQTTEIVAPTIVQRDFYRIICKTGSSATPLSAFKGKGASQFFQYTALGFKPLANSTSRLKTTS